VWNYIFLIFNIVFLGFNIYQLITYLKRKKKIKNEKSRIKNKLEVWIENLKAIVGTITETSNYIKTNPNNPITELKFGISSLGHSSNSILVSMEKELDTI
jgi:hypothetical protein